MHSCSTAFVWFLCAMPSAFLFLLCMLLAVSNQSQSLNDLSYSVMFLPYSSLCVFCLYPALKVESSSMCVSSVEVGVFSDVVYEF